MTEFGDPGFAYHKTMAQVLGLTVAKMADSPLVPLNATDYAIALKGYVSQVENKLATFANAEYEPSTDDEITEFRARSVGTIVNGNPEAFKLSLAQLQSSVAELKEAAIKLDAKSAKLIEKVNKHIPWWRWITKLKLLHEIRFTNTKYKKIERAFLYQGGLDGRPWFKHVVFAPGIWTGYAGGEL
jgi:N-acetylated-alpha-linked acidic dipeptidase